MMSTFPFGSNSLTLETLLLEAPRHATLQLIPNIFFLYFVGQWSRSLYWKLKGRGPVGAAIEAYHRLRSLSYGYILRIPSIRKKVQADLDTAMERMSDALVPPATTRHLKLPKKGLSDEDITAELEDLTHLKRTRWEEGKVSGSVYYGNEELLQLQTQAWNKFAYANPIHPDVFPGARKMEAEVVSMVLNMFHAPSGAAGVCTTGGSESILMACYGARQRGYAEKGITKPEMILPTTAHPAFRKACDYFGIKPQIVACPAPDYKIDTRSVSRLINRNTVILIGSACNFPYGTIDDISALSQLAQKNDICLHVDSCLGSFVVACLEKAGFEAPVCDFRLEGVTSISCDTHKYGFAPKGTSTVLYRTKKLRTYQYYVCPEWCGGVYGSPGMGGSRAGALIAACWASMMSIGEEGYIDACTKIVGTTKLIVQAAKESEVLKGNLEVMGSPLASVVAFTSQTLNVYNIADAMSARGWSLSSLQDPPALHITVTYPTIKGWRDLIQHLESVVDEERQNLHARAIAGVDVDAQPAGASAALYGVAGALPNKSVVTEVARGFLDILYKA